MRLSSRLMYFRNHRHRDVKYNLVGLKNSKHRPFVGNAFPRDAPSATVQGCIARKPPLLLDSLHLLRPAQRRIETFILPPLLFFSYPTFVARARGTPLVKIVLQFSKIRFVWMVASAISDRGIECRAARNFDSVNCDRQYTYPSVSVHV